MTNDELRVKIAKLRGANWWEIDGKAYICGMSHAAMLPKGVNLVDTPSPEAKKYYRISNWPVDIAAAWELVEEMVNNRKRPKIARVSENEWYAGVDHNSDYFGFADTAPRAICLSYIAWKEGRGE